MAWEFGHVRRTTMFSLAHPFPHPLGEKLTFLTIWIWYHGFPRNHSQVEATLVFFCERNRKSQPSAVSLLLLIPCYRIIVDLVSNPHRIFVSDGVFWGWWSAILILKSSLFLPPASPKSLTFISSPSRIPGRFLIDHKSIIGEGEREVPGGDWLGYRLMILAATPWSLTKHHVSRDLCPLLEGVTKPAGSVSWATQRCIIVR